MYVYPISASATSRALDEINFDFNKSCSRECCKLNQSNSNCSTSRIPHGGIAFVCISVYVLAVFYQENNIILTNVVAQIMAERH